MNTGIQVYRKLSYFYENQIPIHFCLLRSGWKNGKIVDLSSEKLTLILEEFKEGVLPFLLEDIDVNTIEAYREAKR
jgi:hypothetical protein